MGSLGQQRLVAIADWNGGLIAREAKAMVPSACAWLERSVGHRQSLYQRAIAGAVRSQNPFQTIRGSWLIRRLSPDSNPIEIAELPGKRDEETLLRAMGIEAGNVHLGSGRPQKVLADLRRRESRWLRTAGRDMAKRHGTRMESVPRFRLVMPGTFPRWLQVCQASLAPPNLIMWRGLTSLVAAVGDDCRRLHARYMRVRAKLMAIASRLAGARPDTPQVGRRAG